MLHRSRPPPYLLAATCLTSGSGARPSSDARMRAGGAALATRDEASPSKVGAEADKVVRSFSTIRGFRCDPALSVLMILRRPRITRSDVHTHCVLLRFPHIRRGLKRLRNLIPE